MPTTTTTTALHSIASGLRAAITVLLLLSIIFYTNALEHQHHNMMPLQQQQGGVSAKVPSEVLSNNFRYHLASKTEYFISKDNNINNKSNNKKQRKCINLNSKQPAKPLYSIKISRHGSRNPTESDYANFKQIALFILKNRALINKLPRLAWMFTWLRDHGFSYLRGTEGAGLVTERGLEVLKGMGHRFAEGYVHSIFSEEERKERANEREKARIEQQFNDDTNEFNNKNSMYKYYKEQHESANYKQFQEEAMMRQQQQQQSQQQQQQSQEQQHEAQVFNVEIAHTEVKRTKQSAEAFMKGVTEAFSANTVPAVQVKFVNITSSIDTMKILRFFKVCPAYANEKDRIDEEIRENKAIVKLKEAITAKVNAQFSEQAEQELGKQFTNALKVNRKQVESMLKLCAYDITLYNEHNHFCTLFTIDDMKTFELIEDIIIYSTKSYGEKINYFIACPLLSFIMQRMQEQVAYLEYMDLKTGSTTTGTSTTLPAATVLFAHLETIMPLISLMGLFKGDNATAHNNGLLIDSPTGVPNIKALEKREFRSSYIGTFASNIELVLYKCEEELTAEEEQAMMAHAHDKKFKKVKSRLETIMDQYKVKIMHNERAVTVPGCDDHELCSISKLHSVFKSFIGNKCSLGSICNK